MRPLLVLLLVLGALGALFFALSQMGAPRGGGGRGLTVAPPTATSEPETPAMLEPAAGPSEPVAAQAEPLDGRTAVQGSTGPGNRPARFGSLAGIVQDENQLPIADANVSLMNYRPSSGLGSEDSFLLRGIDPPKPYQKLVTGKDGRFRFERLDPDKDWSLVVTHERYVRFESPTSIEVPEGGEWSDLITLTPGLTCSGIVRDARTKEPIVGATLVVDSAMAATSRKKSAARIEAKTDAQGSYTFYNAAQSPLQPRILTVSAPGYATQVINNFAMANLGEPETRFKNVQGDAKIESKVQDFELEPGLTIAGRVVRPDGRGVPGFEVEAMNQAGTVGSVGRDVSAEEGNFLIEGLAEGIYLVRLVPSGNYDAPALQRVEAGSTDAVLELFEQASVVGRVVDPAGQPVRRFTVKARAANELSKAFGAVLASRTVKESADGSFELSGLPEGTYVIEAQSEGYASSFSDRFSATQGLAAGDVVVRMSRGGTLSGQVVDASSGTPIAGAEVATLDNNFMEGDIFELFSALEPTALTKAKVLTDADGRFTIERMTPEKYQVQVRVRGYSRLAMNDVEVTDAGVTELPLLRLGRGARVTGVVLGVDSSPLAGASVQLSPNGVEMQGFRETRTDSAGRFVMENVLPGAFELSATRPGSGTGNPFERIGDMQESRMDVTIEEGGTYDFKVRLRSR